MTRNKTLLLAVGAVIVISVVAYIIASGMGGSVDERVAGTSAEVEQPIEVPVSEPVVEDQPAVDSTASTTTDQNPAKPQAKATTDNTKKPAQQFGAGTPGQGSDRPAGARSGMGLAFLIMGIGRLEESGNETLTASQAKQVVALVEPLRAQKTLDQEKAEIAAKKIMELLTDKQKEAMMGGFGNRPQRPEGQERRAERPGGEAREPRPERPGGEARERPAAPPDGARRPAFNPDPNPLNPGSESPFAERMNAAFSKIKAKAR